MVNAIVLHQVLENLDFLFDELLSPILFPVLIVHLRPFAPETFFVLWVTDLLHIFDTAKLNLKDFSLFGIGNHHDEVVRVIEKLHQWKDMRNAVDHKTILHWRMKLQSQKKIVFLLRPAKKRNTVAFEVQVFI
jgi:hypothetical protein